MTSAKSEEAGVFATIRTRRFTLGTGFGAILAAGALSLGGCPGSPGSGSLLSSGSDWNVSGALAWTVTGWKPTDGLWVPDIDAGTFQDRAVTITLIEGVPDNYADNWEARIAAQPVDGVVSAPSYTDDGAASVVYQPPAEFTGAAEFSYIVTVDGVDSNAAVVNVVVCPEVRFRVTPTSGTAPLTARATAYTTNGADLPEGEYTWSFGDVRDSGTAMTHRERSYSFQSAGTYVVTLACTLAGMTAPIGCKSDDQSDKVTVRVSPQGANANALDGDDSPPSPDDELAIHISGYVKTAAEYPYDGVTLTASNDGGTATTDHTGYYDLVVPFGWSGEVTPELDECTFEPGNRVYSSVRDDSGHQDYVITVPGEPLANAGSDQSAGLTAIVLLDGSNSRDHEGSNNLQYRWEQTSGPAVTLKNPNLRVARFVAPAGDADDTFDLAFRLTVTDTYTGAQASDTATVHVQLERQSMLNALHKALERFWDVRVEFDVNGTKMDGFAAFAAADGGVGFWGNEAYAWCDEPMWDFQGGDGIAGAIIAYSNAYQATQNAEYLRRAQSLGDSMLAVQAAMGGGWWQDAAWIGGQWQNVGVWGDWGERRHTPDGLQDLYTLDDSTSQSCGLALVRLYEAGAGDKYLAGARMFGDALANLPDVEYMGEHPYAAGGIPQVMPLDRALACDYNQNHDERSPDGPYMADKTNNDYTSAHAIIFLMELYRVTNDPAYLAAVRLNVDYLLDRQIATGNRGWAQQYGLLTDEPSWARHKEPPAYVTCENGIVEMLLLWHQRESDATRKTRIEAAIQNYLEWLRDDVEAYGTDSYGRKIVWRYYNHDTGAAALNAVTFADDFNIFFGAEHVGDAGTGQPYYGVWDASWIYKILDGDGQLDVNLATPFIDDTFDDPLSIGFVAWSNSYASQDEAGAWPSAITVNGQTRTKINTNDTVDRVLGLIAKYEDMSEALTDSDADGYVDTEEATLGTDPHDSADHP